MAEIGSGHEEPNVWGLYSGRILGGVVVFVLGLGTVAYRSFEGWGWIDSLYFSVITLTSVGYGDLTPTSDGAKLFTVFYLVIGLSLLGAALNEILKRQRRRRFQQHQDRNTTPER